METICLLSADHVTGSHKLWMMVLKCILEGTLTFSVYSVITSRQSHGGSFKLISQIKSSLVINIFIKILDCLSFRSWTDRESPVRLGKCHYCYYYYDLLKNNFQYYSTGNCNLVAVHQLHHHFVGKY